MVGPVLAVAVMNCEAMVGTGSLGFMAGGSMYLPENDPDTENSKQALDPIDRFLWPNLPYMVQFNGSKMFAPNATHAAAGQEARLRRPAPDQGPPTEGRRSDDARP